LIGERAEYFDGVDGFGEHLRRRHGVDDLEPEDVVESCFHQRWMKEKALEAGRDYASGDTDCKFMYFCLFLCGVENFR
jgi:hypothetical protein